MVSVQNLHRPMLWGFFFAYPLVLSADVRDLSVDRSHHVSYLCHPSMNAGSQAARPKELHGSEQYRQGRMRRRSTRRREHANLATISETYMGMGS